MQNGFEPPPPADRGFKRDGGANGGMIAIAGSKGGCGTSTVTLGLAGAFARAGTPTLAVDADRQLPNLHVMTGLDREPTVAALENGADLREVSQPHPETPNVAVLTAPTPDQAVEYGRLGDRLDLEGVRALVDCPSGAGPDVADPLSGADGAVVVATGTDRGLEAAETTVELARRLGVPIYGTVFNRCSGIPDRAELAGVPPLGHVPERPSPLSNAEVATALDAVAGRIASRNPVRPRPSDGYDRVPTGTEPLDDHLDGGLPPGSLVALVADPASGAERLLHRLTGVRGTLYLSTGRSSSAVSRAVGTTPGSGTPTVRRVVGEDATGDALGLIGKLPDAANLIVDPVDPLERRDRGTYVRFLDAVVDRLTETDGLAVVHCLETTANRSATLRAADAVFQVDADGRLSISKYRPDADAVGAVELGFADRVPPAPSSPAGRG